MISPIAEISREMEMSGVSWCWAPLLKSRASGRHSPAPLWPQGEGQPWHHTSCSLWNSSHGLGSQLGWDHHHQSWTLVPFPAPALRSATRGQMPLPTVTGILSELPLRQWQLCDSRVHSSALLPQHAFPGAAQQVQICTFYGPALKAHKALD